MRKQVWMIVFFTTLTWASEIDQKIVDNLDFVLTLEMIEDAPDGDVSTFAEISPEIIEGKKSVSEESK